MKKKDSTFEEDMDTLEQEDQENLDPETSGDNDSMSDDDAPLSLEEVQRRLEASEASEEAEIEASNSGETEIEASNSEETEGSPKISKKAQKAQKAEAKKLSKQAAKEQKAQKAAQQELEDDEDSTYDSDDYSSASDDSLDLYLVSDKAVPGLLEYLNDCGLAVTDIFDGVEPLKNTLLLQSSRARIVIIDSGTGRFISPNVRKELVDIIGMNDENLQFTIFYTDNILKSTTIQELGKMGKELEWVKYSSTVVVAAYLLMKHEKYNIRRKAMSDAEYSQKTDSLRNKLKYIKGSEVPNRKPEALPQLTVNPDDIVAHFEGDTENEIQSFKVVIHS